MDIYSIIVDETGENNEVNINAKQAIFELTLDNVIFIYEVIITEKIEQFEVVISDTKVSYIIEPSVTFFTSGIGDAPDEQLYCRRNGQWVAFTPEQSLVLGELHTNAYYGDLGKLAYNHSQATGNLHQLSFSGLLNKPTTVQGYGITNIPSWALSVSKPSYTTSEVIEADNLYFTSNRVLGTYLSGYVAIDGNVNASDNVLSAIGKLAYKNHSPITLGSSNGLILNEQELSLQQASATLSGALSSADWSLFNSKIPLSSMGVANGVATLGSDVKIPLSQIPVSLLGQVNYKGLWDASTGLPSLPSIPVSNGDYYIVSVTGSTMMGTINEWKVGDWLIANGNTWGKVDNTDAVSSVNGYTGTVSLNKSDIGLSNVVNVLQWHNTNHPTTTSGYGLPDYPITLPASDVYSWAKQSTKPSYNWSEIVTKPTTLLGYGITDAIQNQNSITQTANFNIDGIGTASQFKSIIPTGTSPFLVTSTSMVMNLNAHYFGGLLPFEFYRSGSTVANSTLWNSQVYANNQQVANYVMVTNGSGSWGYTSNAQFKADLGLGSSAYTNTNDHILNQNASAQSANLWINGTLRSDFIAGNLNINYNNGITSSLAYWGGGTSPKFTVDGSGTANFSSTVNATQLQSSVATGTSPLAVNSTTMVNNLNAQYLGNYWTNDGTTFITKYNSSPYLTSNIGFLYNTNDEPRGINGLYSVLINKNQGGDYGSILALDIEPGQGHLYTKTIYNGSWSGWRTIYDSGNLTNTLTTNYIPKWNGSSMVNSLISDDGSRISIEYANSSTTTPTLNLSQGYVGGGSTTYAILAGAGDASHTITLRGKPTSGVTTSFATNASDTMSFSEYGGNFIFYKKNGLLTRQFEIKTDGSIEIPSTTQSTSPTTGALVVGGGIGVGGAVFSNEFSLYTNVKRASIYSDNASLYINSLTSNTIRIQIDGNDKIFIPADGNVGVGYSSDQGYKLAVNGTGYFNGNVTASNFILSSDRTLKTNVQPIIKDYSKLNLVSFNFKDNLDELRFGTIAQDLLSNGFNEFVIGNKDGEYKVKYIDLLVAKIAFLEIEINKLKNK